MSEAPDPAYGDRALADLWCAMPGERHWHPTRVCLVLAITTMVSAITVTMLHIRLAFLVVRRCPASGETVG